MNCSADECSYGELKLVRIHPNGTYDNPQAEIFEALLNDIPENRAMIWRAMERAIHEEAARLIDIEQRGLGFLRFHRDALTMVWPLPGDAK